MKPRGEVLEQNLEALLQRAWRPVHPSPELVERLERSLDPWIGDGGSPAPRARTLRRYAPLIAAAALVLAWLAGAQLLGGERGAQGIEELLARGDVAVRAGLAAEWRAASVAERLRGIEWDPAGGAALELATPRDESIVVRAGESFAVTLAASGRARLSAGATAAPRVELAHGAARVVATSGARVETRPGAFELEGAAHVEHVPAPALLSDATGDELALHVRLEAGRARVGEGDRAPVLAAPTEALLHAGRPWRADGSPWTGAPAGQDGRRVAAVPAEGAVPAEQPGGVSVSDPTAASVAGRVRRAAGGAPVERFRVSLLRALDLPQVADPLVREVSEAQGSFRWDGLEPGTYTVFVQAEGLATWSARELALGAGGVVELDARLAAGGTVRGVVVDRASGEPLAGALVVSESDAPLQVLSIHEGEELALVSARARTAPDGSFQLRHLSAGEHRLRASDTTHAAAWVDTLALRDGELVDGVLFELSPGGGIAGRVERADGSPAAGTFLIAARYDAAALGGVMSYAPGACDAEGRYELAHLAPGYYVVLHFDSPPDQEPLEPSAMSAVEVREGVLARLDFLRAGEGARLSGRVADAEGAPLAGVTLNLTPSGGEEQTGWRAATTGEDGRYALEGLEPDRYRIHVGRGSGLVLKGELELGAGESAARDFHLDGGSLRVRVVEEASGAPVRGVLVLIAPHVDPRGTQAFPALEPLLGKSWPAARSEFEFPFLAPGAYDVVAWDADGRYACCIVEAVELRADETGEATLELRPAAEARIQVVDEDGRPVPGAEVELFDPRGRRLELQSGTTSADGTRNLTQLEPGVWRCVVRRPGFQTEETSLLADPDRVGELQILLRR